MLGKVAALSEMPYQTYQGPLTAGASPLQMKAFQGIGGLELPTAVGQSATDALAIGQQAKGMSFTPGSFTNTFTAPDPYKTGVFSTGTFGAEQAQKYMNPFLQSALNPALEEARRQAEISRVQQAGRLTQAGAFGGGRQAIMESELTRNLMQAQNKMLGEGYASAYDKAMAQFNAEEARRMEAQKAEESSRQFGATQSMTGAQEAARYGMDAAQRSEQSRQFGATYGLDALSKQMEAARLGSTLGLAQSAEQRALMNQMLEAGATQRGIESEGVKADYEEFMRQRDYPLAQLQFQQSMLQGLPIQSVASQYQQPSTLTSTLNTMGGLMDLYQRLYPEQKKG
jgi:hypothetical protein